VIGWQWPEEGRLQGRVGKQTRATFPLSVAATPEKTAQGQPRPALPARPAPFLKHWQLDWQRAKSTGSNLSRAPLSSISPFTAKNQQSPNSATRLLQLHTFPGPNHHFHLFFPLLFASPSLICLLLPFSSTLLHILIAHHA